MKTPENYIQWRLRRHMGKTNHELDRITKSAKPGPHFVFVISRNEIENRDFSRIRADLAVQQQPKELRKLIGKIILTVEGYDQCADELFEIPCVRDYFKEIHYNLPFWLALCRLDSGSLLLSALCVMGNLSVLRRNGRRTFRVRVKRGEATEFFVGGIPLSTVYHLSAGLSPRRNRQRMQAVARNLRLL